VIYGIIVGFTVLAQYSSVPNTCFVLVICYLSMSGVLSNGRVS
jgi:hypothetical protein